jgi:hypothetical protein
MPKRDGIYRKFEVNRTDGTDQKPGDKHFNCAYFVLDISHDKFAGPALLAYAAACEKEMPELAADVRDMAKVNRIENGLEDPPSSEFPPPCYRPIVALAMESKLQDAEGELVKLTQRALDAAIDYKDGAKESITAIRSAALAPSVHKKLWDRYHADLPGDDELQQYLRRELKFNDNAIGHFIAEYKKTVGHGRLSVAGKSTRPCRHVVHGRRKHARMAVGN